MQFLVRLIIAERSVVGVILLNTVALVTLGFVERGTEIEQLARWVDYGCVIYFGVETLLKVMTEGWRPYWQSGWNRFDFVVVVLSTPVLLSPIIDTGALSTLLVLRLGRLFRLFRLLRFIPNRAHLYDGMKRALRASVGVFLALVLINVVLSIGATQLFGKYAEEHFGNPIIASYSLFRIFTIEGWHEIPDAIAQRAPYAVGVIARIYFSASVLLCGILGLSLANAVFVDEMTADNTKDLEGKVDQLLLELRELRGRLDGDTNGDPSRSG